jgi:hypothetical protein
LKFISLDANNRDDSRAYQTARAEKAKTLRSVVPSAASYESTAARKITGRLYQTKLRSNMADESKEHGNESPKTVGLNIRLNPVEDSDRPVLANFTRLNGAPGMVFVDFGFLEPAALSALSRLAQSGGKIPETLTGNLAVRVALGYDTLIALHDQLAEVVAGLKAQQAAKASPAKKDVSH